MAEPRSADQSVRFEMGLNPNLAVPYYLIHSWLYYIADDAVVSDDTFNEVAAVLERHWDAIEHPHKHLLDREFLKSGFHLTYPDRVVFAAKAYRELWR